MAEAKRGLRREGGLLPPPRRHAARTGGGTRVPRRLRGAAAPATLCRDAPGFFIGLRYRR